LRCGSVLPASAPKREVGVVIGPPQREC
jgi:hypothetical protein